MTKEQKLEIDINAALIDVRVGVGSTFTKPTTYVTAKSGFFVVTKHPVATIIQRIGEKVDIPTLEDDLVEGIYPIYPKIPWAVIHPILCFFYKIHKTKNSESYASIWWDKVTEQYIIKVPEQRVSGASVKHVGEFNFPDLVHVLDIHSHNTMKAFFSGTDDADEKYELFYGVVGNLDEIMPHWKFRLRVGKAFVDISADMILQPATVNVKANVVGAMDSTGVVSIPVVADLFSKADDLVPQEWLDQVKDFVVVGSVGRSEVPTFGGFQWGGHYYGGYDAEWHNPTSTVNGKKFKGAKKSKKAKKASNPSSQVGKVYIYIGGECYLRSPDGTQELVDLSTGGNR